MSAQKNMNWKNLCCVAIESFNLQGCLELLGLGEKQVGQQLRCGWQPWKWKLHPSIDPDFWSPILFTKKHGQFLGSVWLGMEDTTRNRQTWHESLDFFWAHLSLERSQDDCCQVRLAGWFGRSMYLPWIPAFYPFQMLGKLPVGKGKYVEHAPSDGNMMGITGYRCVGYNLASHMMFMYPCLKKLQQIFMCGLSTKACNC